jgi:hypothetical protein
MRALVVAAAIVLAGPLEASASATLLFNVDVQSRWNGSGQFNPFTFTQAWNITGTPFTTSDHGAPPKWSNYREVFVPQAVARQPTTFDSQIENELGVSSFATTDLNFQATKTYNLFAGAAGYGSYFFNAQQDFDTLTDLGGGFTHDVWFTTGIQGNSSFPVSDLSKLNYAGIARLLSESGPIHWWGWAGDATINPQHAYSMNYQVEYNGTATFAGVVIPEPATWIVLIVGFGFVGAGIRRRRVTSPECRQKTDARAGEPNIVA